MGLNRSLLLTGLSVIAISLSGCESVDTAMTDMKNKFAKMDLDMPAVTPTNKGYGIPGGENEQSEERFADPGAPVKEEKIALMKREEATQLKLSAEDFIDLTSTEASSVKVANNADCPSVSIIEELDALYQFDNPDRPNPKNKISSIKLQSLETGCVYKDNNVAVELELTFAGELGPRARVWETDSPSFAYPYFLAITSPNGNIVAKEVFAATVTYGKKEEQTTHKENLRQIIPLNGDFDKNHELLIGFQLTEGELAYNRAVKSMPNYAATDVPAPYIETSAGTEEPKREITITPPQKPKIIVVKEKKLKEATTETKAKPAAKKSVEASEKIEIKAKDEAASVIDAEPQETQEIQASMPEPPSIPEDQKTKFEEQDRQMSSELKGIVDTVTKEEEPAPIDITADD